MRKSQIKDLTGQKFGRLTVISLSHQNERKETFWVCNCDCGKKKAIVKGKYLKDGSTKSCGCYRQERIKYIPKNNNKQCSPENYKLPYWKKLKNVFNNMKSRCYNSNDKHYKWYGDKGITVCVEWMDSKTGFKRFYEWSINNGYEEGLSIDRIDFNEPYEPDNCEWTDCKEQCNNMTTNILITYKNKTLTASQWEKEINNIVSARTIRVRWESGVRGKKLFESSEPFSKKEITIDNITKTAKEWAEFIGIDYTTFKTRYKKGLSNEELLKPVNINKQNASKIKKYINKVIVTINNEKLTLKEVSEKHNISIGTIKDRYNKGWTGEDLIKPVKRNKKQ